MAVDRVCLKLEYVRIIIINKFNAVCKAQLPYGLIGRISESFPLLLG